MSDPANEQAKKYIEAFAPPSQSREEIEREFAEIDAAPKNAALDMSTEQPEAPTAQPEESGDPAPVVDAEDTPQTETAENPTELETALRALRRDGYGSQVLDKMAKRDILAIGLKRAKNQEDVDKAFGDLKSLREKAEKNEKPATEGNTPATVTADLSKILPKLAEKLGDEEAPALVAQIVEAIAAPLRAELAELKASNARSVLDTARSRLRERFPGLSDESTWSKVVEKAKQISGGYDNENDCLSDACRILNVSAAQASNGAAETRSRLNGLPSTSGRKPSNAAKSWEELGTDAMLALEAGDKTEMNRLLALQRAAKR